MKLSAFLVALGLVSFGYSQTTTTTVNSSNAVSNGQISKSSFQQNGNFSASSNPAFGTLQPNPTPSGQSTCKAHDLTQQHYADRGLLNEFNQSALLGAQTISAQGMPETPGVNTISVIFHVVHNPNNPAENVSNALIMQVYNDLVEDFQLLNANASNARTNPPFNFVPADANINFCLATQDESGTPLAEIGVVRVATTEEWYDSDGGEENKMKSSASGGSQIWDRNQYLNVWICDISNGANSGTAGYAYRPTPTLLPSSNIDGIVLDYNLGMNNENVLTHEVGHYLGLDHTWGGSGGCTNDDGFSDTPQTAGPSFNYPGSCSGSQTTCSSIETQYENYMDYSNCTVMFTQNQADYMLSILQGIRSSLLISPGCDPTNTPPNSAFSSVPVGPGPVVVPVNGAVNFFDESTNVPTSWAWTISGTQTTDWDYIGGTSATSQNPQVEFYTPGFYDITLTASNSFGTDLTPASETGYIQVVAPTSGTACDTLRNWDPTDAFSYYNVPATNGAWGYIPGHAHLDLYGDGSSVEDALQYAEQFSYVGVAEVRRVRMPFFIVDDVAPTGGSIEVRVYDDNNGANPGTILASETVLLSDLTSGAWNEIDFTTPATVSGTFFVGMELQYGAAQDTVLVGITNTATSGNPSFFMEMDTYGWLNSGLLGINESIAMDVMLSNGPAPVATFTASGDSICVGGTITANGSGSTNVTDYFWYLTDNPFTNVISSSNAPTNDYSPSPAGDYSIFLFGDGSCQTDAVVLDIVVADPVSATVSATPTTCGLNNGSITVSGMTGGNGTYYYSLDGINYQTSPTFNTLPSGTYDVWVATIGDACETMYTVTINPSSGFTAGISPNVSVCPGGSTSITASGGVSYQWFDGSMPLGTTASITVSPAAQTQYSCLVTDASGCQSTVYTTVSVFTPATAPVITASGSLSICSGTSVDLSSSYATNNVWSTTETSSTITVSTAGSYTVTYTDGNGCTSTSAPTAVTVVPTPTIASGTISDPSACGTATGSIEISGSGTGDLSWAGTATGSANNVSLPHIVTGLAAGSYNFTFVDGSTGCTSNVLAQGLNDPNPPATPTITASGTTTFCEGGSVDLSSSYGTGNTWSTSETASTITVTTTSTVSVTYTDGSGCSSTSAPIVITVNPLPNPSTITAGGSTTFCEGGSVDLTSSQGTGNVWSTSETTQTISATTDGTYTVTYTDANGCSETSTPFTVTVNPLPTVTQTPLGLVCEYDPSFTLTGASPAGGTYSGTGVSGSLFDPAVAGIGIHPITYEYTDGNGCTNSATENIEVDGCTSIEEYIQEQINVYPNPTSTIVNVELKGAFSTSMTDAKGRVVFEGSGIDVMNINTESFESGVYFLQIQNDEFQATIRVVKN
ncbi:MAG: T9SS type A sorting domain-containing protein [Flavobacteriales bacterium]|nr:T9SS type A sorting domain-containing protein [Flavobacteriales bacterium]